MNTLVSEIRPGGRRSRPSIPALARGRSLLAGLAVAGLLAASSSPAQASISWGSINNFDTVNDTGVPCHGFEIELDDIHSADITYTYDWNHYGTPKISEDVVFVAGAWHTNVHVRYEAVWTGAAWSAYTAVPSGPIAPTQGHQFTNPGTNFGGEHFGVGFRIQPTTVKYNWLVDDGFHGLALGPPVSVSTPSFTYLPPQPGLAPPQIQAAIVPPPAPIVLEFGEATWVKEIRTTTHTNNEIKLRHLVSPDPDYPDRKDWRNGEPDEVEIEWQILQVDTGSANGGVNGQLVAAAQNLNDQGDDVVTRRYEFYKYVGPLDKETGEAMGDKVGPDGKHGVGIKTINGVSVDLSAEIVVGDYLGAQMSAVDIASPLGLIDHLPDGEADTAYAPRSIVIAGTTNFTASTSGLLPPGLSFNPATGQISGTPTASGVFLFSVSVSSGNQPAMTKAYPMLIAAASEVLPPHGSVDTSASPAGGGATTGTGVYNSGDPVAAVATPSPGFLFLNWTEDGTVVSTNATYDFTLTVNRSLVANFASDPRPSLAFQRAGNSLVLSWPTNYSGFSVQSKTPGPGNWATLTNAVTVVGPNHQVTVSALSGNYLFRLRHP